IPKDRIEPNMQKLLNVFPLPNFFDRNISRGNYNYVTPQLGKEWKIDEFITRIDYNVTQKLRTYFRGNRYTRQQHLPEPQRVPTWGGGTMTDDYRLLGGVLSATYTFSPTLVNEFSFGVKGHKRYVSDIDEQALTKLTRSAVGFVTPQLYPQLNPRDLLPQ